MNDITRPSRSIPEEARPRTRPSPNPRRPVAVEFAECPTTDEDAAWLHRLASAVTAGLIVADPRTALLVTEVLGYPVPTSASISTGQATEARSTGDRRVAP
jgi:hypothetical protein